MGNLYCCDRRKIPFLNPDNVSSSISTEITKSKKSSNRTGAKHRKLNKNVQRRNKIKKISSNINSYTDSLHSGMENPFSVFHKSTESVANHTNKSIKSYSSPSLKPLNISESQVESPKFKSVNLSSEFDKFSYNSKGKSSSGKLESIKKEGPSDKVNNLQYNESRYIHTKSSKFHNSTSAIKQQDDLQSVSKLSSFTISEPDSESLSGSSYEINTYSKSYGIIEESSREYIESNSEYYEPDSRHNINEESKDSIPLNSVTLQEITEEEDKEASKILLEAPDYHLEDIMTLSNEDQISVSWIFKAYAQVNKFQQEPEEVDGFLIVKKKTRFTSMQVRFLLFSTRALYIMKKEYLKDVRRRIDLTDIASLTLAHDGQSFVIHVKPSEPGRDLQLFTENSKDAVISIQTLVFLLVDDFPKIFKPYTKQEFSKLLKSDEVRKDSTSKEPPSRRDS